MQKPKSKTAEKRDLLLRRTGTALPPAEIQLDIFTEFARSTPAEYTHTLELFDAIPKFTLGAKTSLKNKGTSLDIIKRDFEWNNANYRVTIRPVVLDIQKGGKDDRKEMLPGSREEVVYRVLKKMAADPTVERHLRGGKEASVVMRFTASNLRHRLAAVGHNMHFIEIKEALQVLGLTPLMLTNLDTKRELFSSKSYISVDYVSDTKDKTGERSLIEVSFHPLAAMAIIEGLSDWVHYERLMRLHDPLAQWIYETITRNFRQAGVDYGYRLTMKRILSESPMRAGVKLRNNIIRVRESLKRLVENRVLRAFPPYTEKLLRAPASTAGGRRRIEDVEWEVHPSDEVVADIRGDNSRKATMRLKLAAGK